MRVIAPIYRKITAVREDVPERMPEPDLTRLCEPLKMYFLSRVRIPHTLEECVQRFGKE